MNNQKSLMENYDLLAPIKDASHFEFDWALGAEFHDSSGKTYLDMNEMCTVLGQNNREYIHAISSVMNGITSDKEGFGPYKAQLYKYLTESTDGFYKGIHLTVSGSEAVEWAVKLALKMTSRSETISFWNSTHGRTQLSASISGLPKRKEGYGPITPGIIFAPYPNCLECPMKRLNKCGRQCIEMLEKAYTYGSSGDAGALIVEPYQGAGVIIPPHGYLKELYKWCHDHEIVFILDEIQSGMGRTGDMYCYEHEDIRPDMLLLGKALGNGMHIGALLVEKLPDKDALPALSGGIGDETIACAAACEVFRQLEHGLLTHIRQMSGVLENELQTLEKFSCVKEVRSTGLAAAVEFTDESICSRVGRKMKEKGFFTGHIKTALFCKPPYVITDEQLLLFFDNLREIIESESL